MKLKVYIKNLLDPQQPNVLKISVENEIYFWFFALFTFILPLVSGTLTNELYEFPKMYFVYFAGTSLITAYLFTQIWYGKKLPKVPVYIKLYLVSFFVSTIFSMHFYTSLWGYYSRFNDSLMSTLVFFGLYIIAKDKFNASHYEKLFKVALFSSIPVSIVAISQHAELVRVFSTFGQPNWLGQFYAMILPFAHYLFLLDPSTIIWFVISVMGFSGLWFSYSLSGLIGYFLAFVVLLIVFRKKFFSGPENKLNIYKLLFLLFICEVIAITNLGVFKLRIQDVFDDVKKIITHEMQVTNVLAQEIVPSESTSSTESGETTSPTIQRNLSDPGYIRGGMWSGSLRLIFSSWQTALIGTGPETFPYAFQFFRPKELNYSSEWNFVFNKPHNYYLEVAAEQGLFGLISYLYICYVLIRKLDRKYLPIFVAFMVTNVFGWPTVYTTFIFWLLLASLKENENAKL